MKYLKFSSVLLALFLTIGCSSKNVTSEGNTSSDTVQNEQQEVAQANEVPDEIPADESPSAGALDESSADRTQQPPATSDETPSEVSLNDSQPQDEISQNQTSQNEASQYEDGENKAEEGQESQAEAIDSLKTIYFNFDKYNIRDDMKDSIKENAKYIKQNGIKKVVLQGNTDEFGSDEYNMALGQKRALAVRNALVLQGLPKNMFSTISYGSHKSICQEKTSECYAKNRRTDIVEKN